MNRSVQNLALHGIQKPRLHGNRDVWRLFTPSMDPIVDETFLGMLFNLLGDVRADPAIAREILEFIENHRVLSVAMTDAIIGCPHQEGIDYEGEWCPVCEFWHGRDRFTEQRIH
jgi:hypothetical protein